MAWLLVAAAGVVLFLVGLFNPLTATIFGFIVTTLFFMSIVAVLPAVIDDHYESKLQI
jgi:hypothetical protein